MKSLNNLGYKGPLGGLNSLTYCLKKGQLQRAISLLRGSSSWALNISNDRDSTAPSDNHCSAETFHCVLFWFIFPSCYT